MCIKSIIDRLKCLSTSYRLVELNLGRELIQAPYLDYMNVFTLANSGVKGNILLLLLSYELTRSRAELD